MAISFLGYGVGFNPAGGDAVISDSSFWSLLAQNDIVIIVGGHPEETVAAGVSTSGYTELLDTSEGTPNGVRLSANWKRMGASPDTTATGTGSGNALHGTCYIAYAFRGVDTTTAIDATITSASAGTGDPNSPSITTVTNGAVVVSAWINRSSGVSAVTGPSGYSDPQWYSATGNVRPTVGLAWKAVVAGTENPGPWDVDNEDDWIAVSIALRPAEAGFFGSGAFSAGSIAGTATFVGVYEAAGPFSMTGTGTASFIGNPFMSAPVSMTGTGTNSWVGASISTNPVPFSMTGTGTASFVGSLQNAAGLAATGTGRAEFSSSPIYAIRASMTGTVTPFFVGATTKLSHVREVIESRGAATVSIS